MLIHDNTQGQYEAAVEDWDAFRQGAEESKACVSELKELLQQDDPIGPDLEDNFEEISKQRVSTLSNFLLLESDSYPLYRITSQFGWTLLQFRVP